MSIVRLGYTSKHYLETQLTEFSNPFNLLGKVETRLNVCTCWGTFFSIVTRMIILIILNTSIDATINVSLPRIKSNNDDERLKVIFNKHIIFVTRSYYRKESAASKLETNGNSHVG